MVSFGKKLTQSRIMIVDDHDFLRGVLADLLRGLGAYTSHSAANGAEAIQAIPLFKPTLILTDLKMGPVDGIELTNWIRRSPDSLQPEVPIIMITGEAELDAIQGARDAGVNEFIIKPIVPKQVLSKLQAVLMEPREFIRTDGYIGPDRRRRIDPEYTGAFRRDTDPIHVHEHSERAKQAGLGIRTLVMALVKAVANFDPEAKPSVALLVSSITELKKLAMQSDNALVAKAVDSLEIYVGAMGLNGKLLKPILRDHLESIVVLSSPGAWNEQTGQKMIQGLRQTVAGQIAHRKSG